MVSVGCAPQYKMVVTWKGAFFYGLLWSPFIVPFAIMVVPGTTICPGGLHVRSGGSI